MSIAKSVKDFFNPTEESETKSDTEGRFVLTARQILGGMTLYTIMDRETGVCYVTKLGSDCPLTPLLDVDGKPLIR